MFSFKVGSSVLRVTADDARRVRAMATASGVAEVRPAEVGSKVGALGRWVGREAWMACARALTSSRSREGKEAEAFASGLWEAARHGSEARSADLALGLSLLCGARKSEKLATGFEAYDVRSRGSLDGQGVARLLRAALGAIWLAAKNASPPSGAVEEEAEALASQVCDNQRATFDDFGSWYNTSGFELAPWLELLDLDKWPTGAPAATGDYAIAFELSTHDDDDDAERVLRAQFSPLAVSRVRAVAVGSGLFECDAARLGSQLARHASPTGRIHEAGYREALGALCDDAAADERQRVFQLIYDVFKRGRRPVLASDLAAGLAVFCSGSKSAKLAVAWDAVDLQATKDHTLSRRGLCRYIRAFLLVLLALASIPDDPKKNSPDLDAIRDDADSAAVTLVAAVFNDTNRCNFIAFDDFADWYTQGGFHIASWLELLDLNKWVL